MSHLIVKETIGRRPLDLKPPLLSMTSSNSSFTSKGIHQFEASWFRTPSLIVNYNSSFDRKRIYWLEAPWFKTQSPYHDKTIIPHLLAKESIRWRYLDSKHRLSAMTNNDDWIGNLLVGLSVPNQVFFPYKQWSSFCVHWQRTTLEILS